MCRNLEWVACAAQGKLVSQAGADLVFTPPPLSLSIAELWEDANSKIGTYSTKSVYVLETCLLATLCKNADELFRVRAMSTTAPFVCEYDGAMLREFVSKMLSPARRADAMRPD
jgi:hypothetical protein